MNTRTNILLNLFVAKAKDVVPTGPEGSRIEITTKPVVD